MPTQNSQNKISIESMRDLYNPSNNTINL